ncbi:MAG: DNA repair protein RadA [Planctomycetota bacterium]|jgi:DNA repair protein RadA/Sms
MAKKKTVFSCTECGHSAVKWVGKCPGCGLWDTLVEENVTAESSQASKSQLGDGCAQFIAEIRGEDIMRTSCGDTELDRILGGGLVAGSAVLIGGDPGIGKSTLLLQSANRIADLQEKPVLYVTAEESARQIKLRSERLGQVSENILILAENNVNNILKVCEGSNPSLIIIDSIQMVYWPEMSSAPGSVGQVRECASGLIAQAKRKNIPLFIVGHVTKDGSIAGPKVLEHMVDVVLYFEGDKHHSARILRAVKNRFGAIGEIGIYEMASQGLLPVSDPSRLFLSSSDYKSEGTAVTASLEGTRPFLVEVQALVTAGYPGGAKRRISGADSNRVSMLIAVLEKRCGLSLYDQDVFVNIVGGVQLEEPAADLALLTAIAGSLRESSLSKKTICLGEVGLGGEVRPVNSIEQRLKEAERLGFESALVPTENSKKLKNCSLKIIPVREVEDALQNLERSHKNNVNI